LLFTVAQTDYEKLKLNPAISIIGYMTDPGEGKNIITRGGNKHELVAQGWNHLKK
jgi:thiamine-monophosphate kinase